jgi:hypothetical protein
VCIHTGSGPFRTHTIGILAGKAATHLRLAPNACSFTHGFRDCGSGSIVRVADLSRIRGIRSQINPIYSLTSYSFYRSVCFWRVLTMVYTTRDYWVYGHCPSSYILENTEDHDISETFSFRNVSSFMLYSGCMAWNCNLRQTFHIIILSLPKSLNVSLLIVRSVQFSSPPCVAWSLHVRSTSFESIWTR